MVGVDVSSLIFVVMVLLIGCVYGVLKLVFCGIDKLDVLGSWLSLRSLRVFVFGVILGLLGVGFAFFFAVGSLWSLLLALLFMYVMFILSFAVAMIEKPIHCGVLVVGFMIPLVLFLWLNFSVGTVVGSVIAMCWVVSVVIVTYFMEFRVKEE